MLQMCIPSPPWNLRPYVFSASLNYDMGIHSGDKFGGLGGGALKGTLKWPIAVGAQFQLSDTDPTALNIVGSNGVGQSVQLTPTFGFVQHGGTCGSWCTYFHR